MYKRRDREFEARLARLRDAQLAHKEVIDRLTKPEPKVIRWKAGFRPDFALSAGREFYDGDVYYLNLGWFWINFKPWGWYQ
jgi:hypothetical protein